MFTKSKAIACLLTLLCLCAAVVGQTSIPERRKFETHRPLQATQPLPLKITEVKNLQSDRFLSDMEIHVKNVSGKPIYYIRLGLNLPGVKEFTGGRDYGFFLRYGRFQLIDLRERPTESDEPLLPGETHVFKIPPELQGFQSYARTKLPPSATLVVRFRIDTVNFGDGSGFINGGIPWKLRSVAGRINPNRLYAAVLDQRPARSCLTGAQFEFLKSVSTPRDEQLGFVNVLFSPFDCDQNCATWKHYNPNPQIYKCQYGSYTCPYDISEVDPEYPCSRLQTHWFCCGSPTDCPDFNCYTDYSIPC